MVGITWLGHSAFFIELDGYKILVDPWLSNPRAPSKLPDLSDVDLIVITHGHPDHIGETVDIMKKHHRSRAAAIFELANHLIEQGIDGSRVIGGNIGGPMNIGFDGLKIALTPANHSSPIGAPTGVVIIGREATIYHAGDTGIMSEMELIGLIYKPDIALLPIGGHFTMDPVEAAYATKMIKPKVVIPMHYGIFPVLYGSPADFERKVKELVPETRVIVLEPGDRKEIMF